MKHVLVLFSDDLGALPRLLEASFVHPWVASYQIGFGPPVLGSSPALKRRAHGLSALQKLELYLTRCVLDDRERQRLVLLHRKLVVQRRGPVEAESLDEAATEVIDLRARLRRRGEPPRGASDGEWFPSDWPSDCAEFEGRFHLRLDDPRGERLLHHELVASAAGGHRLALELRIDPSARIAWAHWANDLCRDSDYRWFELGRPLSHARRTDDGSRR